MPTEDGRDFVGAEVVVGEVKQHPQLVRDEADEGLLVFLPHQTVAEDAEALVYPKTAHGILCVVVVSVCSEQPLEHLEEGGREGGR